MKWRTCKFNNRHYVIFYQTTCRPMSIYPAKSSTAVTVKGSITLHNILQYPSCVVHTAYKHRG